MKMKSNPANSKILVFCVYQKTMHTPVSLGAVVAYAKQYEQGRLLQSYQFLPKLFYSWGQIQKAMGRQKRAVFLFSDYVWNYRYHLELSKKIKKKYPESVIIHGGPSVPNLESAAISFMQEYPFIDFLVQGEGEVTLAELLSEVVIESRPPRFGMIPGVTYRCDQSDEVVVNTARERAKTLDDFPSAYDDEMFDHLDPKDLIAGIVETNRGCPYGCTYCDWGTRQRIRVFPMEKIEKEMEWVARNKISVLWISDANFGILPRDLDVAKKAAELKQRYGYPKQLFVNYAKNPTQRLAEIVSVLADSGLAAEGIISIQTRDQDTLNIVERENIKNEKFDELIDIFRKKRLPIASDLMIALPGSNLETLKEDTQYFFERDIKIKIYHSQILPNAPMANPDHMQKYQIEVDEDGYIRACHSFDRQEILMIEKYAEVFITLVMFGILKYFLKYLQLDHGVQASEFIDRLTQRVYGDPVTQYVEIKEVLNIFTLKFNQKSQAVDYNWRLIFVSWKSFHREIQTFVRDEFGIAPSEEMSWVLEIQEHLIPSPWKKMPLRKRIRHDLDSYFKQMEQIAFAKSDQRQPVRPLKDFGPGELHVSDPNGFCNLKFYFRFFYNIHIIRFELDSNLRVDTDRAVFINETEGFLFWLHKFLSTFRHLLFSRSHYSGVGNLKRMR